MDSQNPAAGGPGGCLIRLFWMVAGNFALVLTAVRIGQDHTGLSLTGFDFLYWAIAISLPLARYVDIRFLHGQTADSRPATMADWQRYAAAMLGASLLLWLGTHFLFY